MRFHSPDEEQLYDRINGLKHRLRNKRLSSNEEKKLMKEMKELQVEIEKAKSDDSSKLKENQEWEKRQFEWRIGRINWKRPKKSMEERFDILKKQQQENLEELKQWRNHFMAVDHEIKTIQEEIDVEYSKVDLMNRVLLNYQKMDDEANACYYQNMKLLNRSKDFAEKKDMVALAKLSNIELEKFFTKWCENKTFKEDYERKAFQSLESRGLSRDGKSAIIEEILAPPVSDSKIIDDLEERTK